MPVALVQKLVQSMRQVTRITEALDIIGEVLVEGLKKDGIDFGIIGCVVGSSFAVLLAEELFSLECELLISITSAGLIDTTIKTPSFMLIERAIRDEGASYHCIPD